MNFREISKFLTLGSGRLTSDLDPKSALGQKQTPSLTLLYSLSALQVVQIFSNAIDGYTYPAGLSVEILYRNEARHSKFFVQVSNSIFQSTTLKFSF